MKISIITVTKNNKAGLIRAIESVRTQTYKNVEHIVVDGLSTDGTADAIKDLQFTIKNDMSSRAESRDLKDFSGASLLRNDKDRMTMKMSYFDTSTSSVQAQLSMTRHRVILFDKLSMTRAKRTNHHSLITTH